MHPALIVLLVMTSQFIMCTDGAFTWLYSNTTVNFIQGQAAKLNWKVEVGHSWTWASVEIARRITKGGAKQSLIRKTTLTGTTVYLTERAADMDLDIKSTSNIVSVTFVLRNLKRNKDEMFYQIIVVTNDFKSDPGKYTKVVVYAPPIITSPYHNMNYFVGEDAHFQWNTTKGNKILSATWGIRKGNIADPQFISVNSFTVKVIFNFDMDPRYAGRVKFTGNLADGHAWFVIKNLDVDDTNEYIACISDHVSRELPYPVYLQVVKKRVTSTRSVASGNNTRTTSRFTTSPTTTTSNLKTAQPSCTRSYATNAPLVVMSTAIVLLEMSIIV